MSAEKRYLFISGGFALGGSFNQLGPRRNVSVPLPTVAAVHLPLSGGLSQSKSGKGRLDCRNATFPGLTGTALKAAQSKLLMKWGVADSTTESDSNLRGTAHESFMFTQFNDWNVDTFGVAQGVLRMQSSHDTLKHQWPDITFGKDTAIAGVTLGGFPLEVSLDLALFNKLSTLEKLEHAFANDPSIRAKLAKTFLLTQDGQLYRSKSGFLQGSLVKKISGTLPPGARIEEDGYTITWPEFGQIILGQLLISPYLRRATLVRIKHSELEGGGGCSGGSEYP